MSGGATAGAAAALPTATDLMLTEGVILLAVGTLFVIVFRRFGLGAVLGYLCAGALVGPFGLGLVGGGESKLAFAELGIALLLFLVGLELHPRRLWEMRRNILGLGLTQVVVSAIVLTLFIKWAVGFSWGAALAVGAPLALSSTAQVLPGLKSSGRINSPYGERAFGILLFQDISIVPLITLIAALSRAPADPSAPTGVQMALYTVGAVAGLVLAGRFILNPLLRIVGRLGERELFVVVGLLVVLAAASLMHALHLSIALGAFVAGVMLADSPYRHEIEADVEPFRLILLGLFFLAVGMVLDVNAVLERPWLVLGLALGLVAIKTVVLTLIAMASGVDRKQAISLGLLLSQGGEFGFVLFTQAQNAQLIAPEAASLFSAVVTLSMATTPFLMLSARRLELAPPVKSDGLPDPAHAPRGRALVIGHGRFGQSVVQMLHAVGAAVTIIDKKPRQIELAGKFDTTVYFGDGLRIDLLRRAGADDAQIIVLAIDDRNLNAETLQPIVHAFPNARILVRAFDRGHVLKLADADVDVVIREVFESAIDMGRHALKALDVSDEEVADVEATFRKLDDQRMAAQLDSRDLTARADLRFMPGLGHQLARASDLLRDGT